MNVKMTAPKIIILGMTAIFGVLFVSDALTVEFFVVYAVMIVILLFVDKDTKYMIDLLTARTKAKTLVRDLQLRREVISGDIRILPESELKNLVVSSGGDVKIEPEKYNVLLQIEGEKSVYFMVKVSVYGDILGITEVKRKKSIIELEDEYREVGGRPEHLNKIQEAGERAGTTGAPEESGA